MNLLAEKFAFTVVTRVYLLTSSVSECGEIAQTRPFGQRRRFGSCRTLGGISPVGLEFAHTGMRGSLPLEFLAYSLAGATCVA